MIAKGKEYRAIGDDATKRGVAKRRAVYMTSATPTPEQQRAIDILEEGFHGEWHGKDPYNAMRHAEALGIELAEEEQLEDGKWYRTDNPDILISNMEKGAL